MLGLLADGVTTGATSHWDDVMNLARRAGMNIYVIALRGDVALMRHIDMDESMLGAAYVMGAVARESGRSYVRALMQSRGPRSTYHAPSLKRGL